MRQNNEYEGVLPILKPAGFTSHDVVARMRRILGVRRIGHTGTLDPQVTGVLPLCIGRATRLVEYIQEQPKIYEAEMRVGFATDTEDLTGKITEEVQAVHLTEEKVVAVIEGFIGEIEQIPPMYSAVRVDGKRLYDLARQGERVERKPRKATIDFIEILDMDLRPSYPSIRFRVQCSKGTYIRTLCADIGQALDYPAVMARLIRISTGGMTLDQCITLEEAEELVAKGIIHDHIIPGDLAISFIPAVSLSEQHAASAHHGKHLAVAELRAKEGQCIPAGTLVRAYAPDYEARFLGLFRYDGQCLIPEKIFL